MRNKMKYLSIFFILIILCIVGMDLLDSSKESKIKGNIEIAVNENLYEYLKECADKFMEYNPKTNIQIKQINSDKYVDNLKSQIEENELFNIGQLNRLDMKKLSLEDINIDDDMNKVLETYSKNFSKNRLEQVIKDDKKIAIPLNSRPLVLYIREDILSQYGYHNYDISTWNDFVNIGTDIYKKSNGKLKILNATGQDYEDLVSLLVMQSLSKDKSIYDIQQEVEDKLKELKDNNILNLQDGNPFLARISSINGMRELMALDEKCEWVAINTPSKNIGTNRFFCAEGDNLIILNQNNDNKKLIEKFITFVITNNKYTIKYIKEGRFFSSYLYTYKNIEIEDSIKNFNGKSPLIIMSNIEERAPVIKKYDDYIDIKTKVLEENNLR
ncbi:ABC transporter substrate-binding protein [Clostridium weizhouense]|uniref:ABC transporter substrate-binding protein n=1 Tax=Clostridium weizhouense TaxID=2859781 RepID=A0ABS7AK38_9CLOT|nr:ABC transporter substrate-binding protein [Clostridium weizhouense]MBW6408934.1 ABC transporter substrate-binding protein [Clostridium weizhouense]